MRDQGSRVLRSKEAPSLLSSDVKTYSKSRRSARVLISAVPYFTAPFVHTSYCQFRVYAWSLEGVVLQDPYARANRADGSRSAAFDSRGVCMIWFKPVTTPDGKTTGFTVTGKASKSRIFLSPQLHKTCYLNSPLLETSTLLRSIQRTYLPFAPPTGLQSTYFTSSCRVRRTLA